MTPLACVRNAAITWLPIAAGIVAGTLGRAGALLLGASLLAAGAVALACVALGAGLSLAWIRPEGIGSGRTIALTSLTWLGLSVLFRGIWFGWVVGQGPRDVLLDYRVGEGQPGLVILLLVACAPLWLLRQRAAGRAQER